MTKLLICTVFVFVSIIMNTKASIPGGLGASMDADPEATELIDRQRANIIKKICDDEGLPCPSSDAKIDINSYKTQSVAGTNYFLSVTIDGVAYHVRIFSQPWTHTEEVHGVKKATGETEEISYFP